MKQIFILTAALLTCMGMRAQDTGIDSVLRQIEANNKESAGQRTTYLFAEVRE